MIKNSSTVICQQAIIDKVTNLVSYINCIESVKITGSKLVFPEILIASLWENEKDEELEIDYLIEIFDENGIKVKKHKHTGIKVTSRFHRVHTNIKPFEVDNSGDYKIISKIKEKGDDDWNVGSKVSLIVIDKTKKND